MYHHIDWGLQHETHLITTYKCNIRVLAFGLAKSGKLFHITEALKVIHIFILLESWVLLCSELNW